LLFEIKKVKEKKELMALRSLSLPKCTRCSKKIEKSSIKQRNIFLMFPALASHFLHRASRFQKNIFSKHLNFSTHKPALPPGGFF